MHSSALLTIGAYQHFWRSKEMVPPTIAMASIRSPLAWGGVTSSSTFSRASVGCASLVYPPSPRYVSHAVVSSAKHCKPTASLKCARTRRVRHTPTSTDHLALDPPIYTHLPILTTYLLTYLPAHFGPTYLHLTSLLPYFPTSLLTY